MVLADLKPGQRAVVEGYIDHLMALKFMEMGVVPGATVELYAVAPLGDPIAVDVSGVKVSMRRKEAGTVKISLI